MTTYPRSSRCTQSSGSLLPLFHLLLGILLGLLLFPHLPGPVEHPVQPPSVPFSIDYLYPHDASSPLFLSTARFHCRPISVVLSGATYPVKLEAVDAKGFNHSTQSFEEGKGGEVLVVVAENATEQIVLFSLNSIGKGGKTLVAKEVVFRAVDAQGRMAYTTARKVKSPKGDTFTIAAPVSEEADEALGWVLLVILFIVYGIAFLLFFIASGQIASSSFVGRTRI